MSGLSFRQSLFASCFAVLCALAAPASAQDGYAAANVYSSAATSMETRLTSVEDQIRVLTGKVEQVDFVMRRMDQAIQRLQADTDGRIAKLESAMANVNAAPQRAAAPASTTEEESSVDAPSVSGTLGGMKVRGDKVTGATLNPKTPPLPEKPADYGLTPQEQYDRAFGLLRQANYDDAEKAFKTFIDKNPKDKLLDNAKYWYAETFYVRGKFGDAAVAFAEAFEQNQKGTKAPDSLLKLAMSLASVDKVPDACNTLGALKAKYPTASATIRARADQERTRLKCK